MRPSCGQQVRPLQVWQEPGHGAVRFEGGRMKPIRSAITLAAGIALVSLGAHAQTTQGAAPATTPQSGPAATSAAEPATQAGQPSVRDSVDQSQVKRTVRRLLANAIQGTRVKSSS